MACIAVAHLPDFLSPTPARSWERMDSLRRSHTGSPLAAARAASALRPARGRKRMARVTAAHAAASFHRLRPALPPSPVAFHPYMPWVAVIRSPYSPPASTLRRAASGLGNGFPPTARFSLPARPGRASMCRAATAANRRLFGNEVPQHKS